MHCPLKFNSKTIDADGACKDNQCQCEREECELWEHLTGSCSLRTTAYLQAYEANRKQ
jgi:hypothetical protein